MREATTASSLRVDLRVDLVAGPRGVNRLFGRLTVDSQRLAVRSAGSRWIPARSVSKDAVGEISVATRTEIKLPVLRWGRVELVRFQPTGPLADISIKLPPRKRIVDVLRDHGYSAFLFHSW